MQRVQGREPHRHPISTWFPFPRMRPLPRVPEHAYAAADGDHPRSGRELPGVWRADDQAHGSWPHHDLLRRIRLPLRPCEEFHRSLREMRNGRAHDSPRQLREAVRRVLELPGLRQLVPAAATGSHRAHGRPLQVVRTSGNQGHLPRPATVGPLSEHAMSREGSEAQEGGNGEGQGEGRREASAEKEEADAGPHRTGPSDRLGSPHEPDELLQGLRLKRVVRPFLFADRRDAALSVVMARADDQLVIHLADLVEQGIVHLFHAGPGEIHAAAVAHEQAVPGEGVPGDEVAAGVGGVARRVNDLHLELSDLHDGAVLQDEVLSDVAESVGRDLRAGLVGEPLVVEHVIRVMVRVEDERDRVSVLVRDLLEDARVKARIDDGRDLARGIADHVPEVLHRADEMLLEEHGPLDKSLSGLSVLVGAEDRPRPLAKGGRAPCSNDPGHPAYRAGRLWRGGWQPRRSWGSLFRSLTCDIDPRASPLSPWEASSPWATCGYKSSPSSKTAPRKSSRKGLTLSGSSSSFPIRRGRRSWRAKPHSAVFRPLRSDAESWHPSRGLAERPETWRPLPGSRMKSSRCVPVSESNLAGSLGGLLGLAPSPLRRLSRSLSGGTRWRLRLVEGQRDPSRVLEDGEPAHAGNLLLRHGDRAPRRGDLAECVLDVLSEDVVKDPCRQVLRLLESAARCAGRLEHRVVHLRHVLEFPTEDVLEERLRFLGCVRMDLHVHNAVRFLSHVFHPPFSKDTTACVGEVLSHILRGWRKWPAMSHLMGRTADSSNRREREAYEEENPGGQRGQNHGGVRRDEGVRIVLGGPEPSHGPGREGERQKAEQGPGSQAGAKDTDQEDDVRGRHQARRGRRGPRDPEPDPQRSFPDGSVCGDVRDLVDPQDSRHQDTEGQ